MGIVVLGAVFVDIKGYPADVYIPGGRNAGRVEIVHGGVSRNLVEDIANVELRPTFVSLVDTTGTALTSLLRLGALYCDLEAAFGKPIDLITVGSILQPSPTESDSDFAAAVLRERVKLNAVA